MRKNMSGNLGLYKYLWPGSVCVCVYVYTFICRKLIEELETSGADFWPYSDKFESWNFFHTFDEVMT